MEFRKLFRAAVSALVTLVFFQSIAHAHGGGLAGQVHILGSHHRILAPTPPPTPAPNTVNVRDYGATGDGSTDDTAAIQNAINAARASGKGVLFPAGTYLHASNIVANSVALVGVGGATVLMASNSKATAVVLTGMSPSIQNMVVSSTMASSGLQDTIPTDATVLVTAAQYFVVQGITINQGAGRVGVYIQQSAIGQVSSVSLNGTGSTKDLGVIVDGCGNTSLVGNLFLNEGTGISLGGYSTFQNQSIAVISNNINALAYGIVANAMGTGINVILDIESNSIQIANTNQKVMPLFINNSATYYVVLRNVMSGGIDGMTCFNPPNYSGLIQENTIRNVTEWGAAIATTNSSGTIQFLGNQFGECGLSYPNSQVILAIAAGGPDSIILMNNSYQGHANSLGYFMYGLFHIDVVAGNTQTQTTLPNSIP